MGLNSVYERMDLEIESLNKNPTVYGGITPSPDIIKTQLFWLQKKGLHWLYDRETSEELPPFWVEKDDGFTNILTNCETGNRPDPLRGGIFANESGSGKKLTLLSLIALDKCTPDTETNEVNEDQVSSESLEESPSESLEESPSESLEESPSESLEDSPREMDVKTTLIICSQSSVSLWKREIDKHTKLGTLKYWAYDGSKDADIAELQTSDIILTTYTKFRSWANSKEDYNYIKGMKWWRVILEEDNVLRNQKSKIVTTVNNLNARNRWLVTGKRMEDISTELLFSFVKIIKFYPFSSQSQWARLEMTKGRRIQGLIALLSLGVTKNDAQIGLPKMINKMCKVDLSDYERHLYDALEIKGRNVQDKALSSIIQQLRMLSAHTELLSSDVIASISSRKFKDASEEALLLKKVVEKLKEEADDYVCSICMSPPFWLSTTSCTHIFCERCMMESLRRSISENSPYLCPMCRSQLVTADLFSIPEQHVPDFIRSNRKTSSKVTALQELLKKSRDVKPDIKSVVFSEFDQLLRFIEKQLKEAGFKVFRIEGAGNRNNNLLREFSVYGEAAVLLASPECKFRDLTMASMIYIMEPWLDANTEEKVINKVHQIGQTAAVEVMRLVTSNSIEEKVMLMRKSQGNLNKKETQLTRLRALIAL